MSLLLADKIKARREELGLSKASLGRAVGVTGQAISLWESGARQISLDVLGQLAAALGVNPQELLPGPEIAPIDPRILALSLISLDSVAPSLSATLSNEQKAKIIAFIYGKGGEAPKEEVLALCRLVT